MNNIVKSFSLALLVSSLALAMENPTPPKLQSLRPSLSHILAIKQPWVARFTANDEKLIVGSTNAELIIWDTHNFSTSKSFSVTAGAFNLDTHPTDTAQIVISDGQIHPIHFWNIEDNTRATLALTANMVRALQYNRTGSQLLVAHDKVCQVYDVHTHQKVREFSCEGQVWNAVLNPADNNYMAASYGGGFLTPTTKNKISVWDLRKYQPLHTIQADVPVGLIKYNNSGTQLVGTAPGQLVAYDVKTAALISYYNLEGKRVKQPVTDVHDVVDAIECMPENDTTFVVGLSNKKILFCNTRDDSESFSFDAVEGNDSGGIEDINALAIHPNGKFMASGLFFRNCIQMWDIAAVKEKINASKKS